MSALPTAVVSERPVERSEVRAFLASALSAPRRGPLAITIPAPIGRPLALLDGLRRGDAVHLHDDKRAWTALGATRLTKLEGPERCHDARRAYETARDALGLVAHERAGDARPTWAFGLSFAPGRARDPWTTLGDGLLVLPRWAHRVENGAATLTLVVDQDEPSGAALALAELDALWEGLSAPSRSLGEPLRAQARHVDPERWRRSIDDVKRRIDAGEAEKIVVARRSLVLASRAIDPAALLRRLERPGATHFCIRRRGVAFVGATPERLFRKRGRLVHTEAVAGTASLERDPAAHALLASIKDVHEHQVVVDGIAAVLSGMRGEVSIGTRGLRTIGAIAHLVTQIEARMVRDTSAFELLEALHPTAAVGGAPRATALRWIADHEPDRGWYAGPVGWIDAHGNAEVHVALRSALLVGARAYAYAGCGVVSASDPDAEYAETALKLAPMLSALGVPA